MKVEGGEDDHTVGGGVGVGVREMEVRRRQGLGTRSALHCQLVAPLLWFCTADNHWESARAVRVWTSYVVRMEWWMRARRSGRCHERGGSLSTLHCAPFRHLRE